MEKPVDSANCPYCLSPIEGGAETVRCPVCGVAHHAECWRMNGKCSVYGCDGWQAWSEAITDKIAPRVAGRITIDATAATRRVANGEPEPLCIECGSTVKPGELVCANCRRSERPRLFESCAGPSVIALGGLIAMILLLLKRLF